jgi:2-keto-4-pentenoate hydratase/2-oxohepta-3-ene-1,7-dioic acid hydratase in catechol pathway
MQEAHTGDMIFDVPSLVAYLSLVVILLPGDLIFTSTPSGVGYTRRPRRFLRPGDELVTWVEGTGEMRHHLESPIADGPGPSKRRPCRTVHDGARE